MTIYTHVLKSRNLINIFRLHKAQDDTAPALIPQKTVHTEIRRREERNQAITARFQDIFDKKKGGRSLPDCIA